MTLIISTEILLSAEKRINCPTKKFDFTEFVGMTTLGGENIDE